MSHGCTGTTRKQKHSCRYARITGPQGRKSSTGAKQNQGDAVFFDIRGIVHDEYAPEGQTVTKDYYQVLRRLHDAVRRKKPDLWTTKNCQLLHNNGQAHSSHMIQTFLGKLGIPGLHQYSPDMAPCDFWFFPKFKTILKGSRFESRGEIVQVATAEMITIPTEVFQKCFRQWKDRWVKCVEVQGVYFEGD